LNRRWLKVDLHIHTGEDPKDNIAYKAKELIKKAALLGFEAVAITNHNRVTYNQELKDYASQYNLYLIPGAEISCERKHILVINPPSEIEGKKFTWSDLKEMRKDNSLLIAPHPYFPGCKSLFRLLDEYHYLFDAIEFSAFYNKFFNPNTRAIEASQKYKKPLVACSDAHNLWQLGTTFTLVEAEPSVEGIVQAIKENRIKIRSRPISLLTMARIMTNFFLADRLKLPLHI